MGATCSRPVARAGKESLAPPGSERSLNDVKPEIVAPDRNDPSAASVPDLGALDVALPILEACSAAGTPAQAWVLQAVKPPAARVPTALWIVYRRWVDKKVAGLEGRSEHFHRFAVCRALGLEALPRVDAADAADLIVCLAQGSLLGAATDAPGEGSAEAALSALLDWLAGALAAFGTRFRLAAGRGCPGFTQAEEGAWRGEYHFVQICDPQLGMCQMDKTWSEEVAMLKVAIVQINQLRPRFVLVSGDMGNGGDDAHGENTVQALRFGERCATIVNSARVGAISAAQALATVDDALKACELSMRSLEDKGRTGLPAYSQLKARHASLAVRRQQLGV